jgi:CMP-N,N'-diacetyllegionaminic acid synthase
MEGSMRILGVIPARGGSKRVPRKNLQVVGGRTLLEHACAHASEAHLLDHWVVSTDMTDEWVAEAIGPGHLLQRPASLAQDDTPMAPVLLHAAEATGGNWDAIVTIQPTSPLRTARDIDRCIAEYLTTCEKYDDSPESVVSINESTRARNGAVYVTPMHTLKFDGRVFWDHSRQYRMPASRSLDINEPADIEEARRILGP